jgi:predicted transposase/invertase (TIGR01784 family)
MFSIKHLLPKFKPHSFHDKKMIVLWSRYLTEIDETRKAPEELLANPETRKALDIVEESAYTDAQMAGYDHFWEAVSWERTLVSAALKRSEQAHKKGYEVGMEKGMKKGILSERLRNARAMKRMNVPLDTIIQVTGLSKEEIDRL